MRREMRSRRAKTRAAGAVTTPWSVGAASTEMGDAVSRQAGSRWRSVDGSRRVRFVGGSREDPSAVSRYRYL
ncbi:hypothetical protein G6O67_001187 [Ophiocordyceps sinensis]|uniref:Uncharacterized protein n=1 Tax=Ophiocordyceps sinensis TaxID=72228 RepID=A0A8H4V8M5_9HYPO|nr:hypothetical protein G6O67_001187 [Ophiocordyceps sinensis]